jgi:site-specific DNA recombinase
MNKKRVFLYVRVSTQEQARDGYSIDEQIDRLRDYCKAMGWIIVKIYTDGGYSGSNTDRPALQDMIRDIEAKKGDSVVVYKLDRLSRSQKDTLELIEDYFLANKVDFVSMTENFDTATPFGRAMIGILSVFAQLEREQIKERMSMGREGRAKEGKFHGGGYEPIGYDYIDGLLKINEFEAMQIREIHKLFQEGKAFRAIEKIFADKGYTHKHGNWYPKRIKGCMLNDLYIGNVHYAGQVFKGEHDPIVDEETFNKSIALYNSKDYSNCKNAGRTSYLGGLLFCSQCHARYAVSTFKSNGKEYRYYGCRSRRKVNRAMIKDPNCKNMNYKAETLDKMIFDEIRKLATDPSHVHEIKKKNFSDDDLTKTKLIEKEIAKIDAQKSRYMDFYAIDEYTMEEVQAKVKPLNEQRKKLENELHTLANGKSALSEEDALELLESWEDVVEEGDFERIRMLINALIEKIEIDNEDIDIHWKFA